MSSNASPVSRGRQFLPPTRQRADQDAFNDATNSPEPPSSSRKVHRSPRRDPAVAAKAAALADAVSGRGGGKGGTKGRRASSDWLDITAKMDPSPSQALTSPDKGTHRSKLKGLVGKGPLRKGGTAAAAAASAGKRTREDEDEDRRKLRKLEEDNLSLQDRVTKLEAKRAKLQRKNDTLEDKCDGLMRRNDDLVRQLDAAKRDAYRSGMKHQAEEEIRKEEKENEDRIAGQTLLPGSVMSHVKKCMATSAENLAWQLQDKPHFSLNVPSSAEGWTCSELYRHQKSAGVVAEMGITLANSYQKKDEAK